MPAFCSIVVNNALKTQRGAFYWCCTGKRLLFDALSDRFRRKTKNADTGILCVLRCLRSAVLEPLQASIKDRFLMHCAIDFGTRQKTQASEYLVYCDACVLQYCVKRYAQGAKGRSFIDARDYSLGPASTRALPASLPVYLAKFLTKRPARSFALVSHSATSA